MRTSFILLAAAAIGAPAVAAQPYPEAQPQSQPHPQPQADEVAAAQRALRDPTTVATVGRLGGAMTRAVMNMPVGEIEAAIEGRAPTAADRRRTVQDSIGGPAAAAQIEREVAASGTQMQAMGNALANALPGMVAAATQMSREIERATRNLPDPTYPRR